ncbi:SIMPL domain-containing protein [Patescibacteria group bacterium]
MFRKKLDVKNSKHVHCILACLIGLIMILLIVIIISTIFGISNKIKQGRYIGQEIETKNTITVSDSAEIYAKPDLALINVSVITESKTVTSAMSQNTEKINKISEYLKKAGVNKSDLKTTNFNIFPIYEYPDSRSYSIEKRVLTGYEVRQTLQVKIRELEKTGELIQGATDAGANQVGNLQFSIDKQDELLKEAREQAINKVKDKAKELAGQLGIRLVRITNFSEGGGAPIYKNMDFAMTEGLGIGGGGAVAPEIETGENKIEVSVSITYEIN